MYTVLMDGVTIHDPSLNNSAHLIVDGVVKKQVNKADSFSFTIYPDNVGYAALELMTSWISVYKDGSLIFHGRPLTEETGWDNEKKIVCEGDLAILNDTVIRPYSFSGTLGDYVRMVVNQHNAQVESAKQITVRQIDQSTTTMIRRTGEYKSTMQELFEKVVDYFGGYILMEYDSGQLYISYLSDSTNGTNQTLEIGKNILSFNRSISSEALATALIPLGATDEETGERLTIESVNSGSDYITSSETATKGYLYATYTFDDITDASELLTKARTLLTDLVRVSPRIELSAVDLSDAGYDSDAIGFFEYVTVQDTAHTVSGRYLITERTYNISEPQNDTVTFGSEEKTISGQTAKTQSSVSSMTDAIINKAVEIVAYQTDLLKGGSGGYFVIGTDTDGHPSEIYFMDTDDTSTAVSVLRINQNGIGFSTTGFDGPYTNAWTIDGNLNADFITTGTLSADRIAAGSLAIGKLSSDAQSSLASSASTSIQYYLSTSSSSATGGSWSTTMPTWSSGKYIWTRTANTVTNAAGTSTTTYVPSSSGQYDSALTTALSTAASAASTANSGLASAVPLYYSTSSSAPSAPTSHVSTSTDTTDAWTTVMPSPTYGNTFYTCNEYRSQGGTYSWSSVTEIPNATYTSSWCSSTDSTYIDGGRIYTGTITADRIVAGDTFTQTLYATDFNITGGSINISTSSQSFDVIQLIYGSTSALPYYSAMFRPDGLTLNYTNSSGQSYYTEYDYGGITLESGYTTQISAFDIEMKDTNSVMRTRVMGSGTIILYNSSGTSAFYASGTGSVNIGSANAAMGSLNIYSSTSSAYCSVSPGNILFCNSSGYSNGSFSGSSIAIGSASSSGATAGTAYIYDASATATIRLAGSSGTVSATALALGGTSSTASLTGYASSSTTYFDLTNANGLRFYSSGSLVGQFGPNGATMTSNVTITGGYLYMQAAAATSSIVFQSNDGAGGARSAILQSMSATNGIYSPSVMRFRTYSHDSSSGAMLSYYEQYSLPTTTEDLTESHLYKVLTNKGSTYCSTSATTKTYTLAARNAYLLTVSRYATTSTAYDGVYLISCHASNSHVTPILTPTSGAPTVSVSGTTLTVTTGASYTMIHMIALGYAYDYTETGVIY